MSKNAYAQSGVDVEAGYEVVERIKKHVARTERAGFMGGLGGFGGMFDLSKTGVKEPVLICPLLVATAISAIVASSVSPERCEVTEV